MEEFYMVVIVVNVGSTSLKFKLFEMDDETILAEGKIEGISKEKSEYKFSSKDGIIQQGTESFADYNAGINRILKFLINEAKIIKDIKEITAVGFKTVIAKGINDAVLLTDDVVEKMEEFIPVAPAHNPSYINAIKNIKQLLPDKSLVGLFEPAFHKTIPEYAYCYGVPYEWIEKYGIRKYGFHGASLRYVSERITNILGKTDLKQIICHLGGSSSIGAVKDGKSIDTSMGFSPQSGIPHSTRHGDLDPFVVLYLMKKENLFVDDMIEKLSKESGLLGISGVSGEMKDIVESAKNGNKRAQLAIDSFVYNVKKYIGSYIAILEGLDVLVFTGGIGEGSDLIREKICSGLEFLGIKINSQKNKNVPKDIEVEISLSDSKAKIFVVPTNEEIIVARATVDVVRKHNLGFK